jgi:hypothetical protein
MYKDSIQISFKIHLPALALLFFSLPAYSQFYYKDQVATRDIISRFQLYKVNKVNAVKLNSFQGEEPVTEGFVCEQKVNPAQNQLVTYTKTADAGESYLTAVYSNQGLLAKAIDSTEETVSTSNYTYDGNKRLVQLSIETKARDNSSQSSEKHLWEYSAQGKPVRMTRVRNGRDTTLVHFTLDDNGNVIEEESFRQGKSEGKVYYYYDDKHRLTDVVRYNVKARRLLPDYIFEYEDEELSSMTLVPEGSDDYQKWYYTYDENGLKQADFCYNKKNVLLGKIEYKYQFGR